MEKGGWGSGRGSCIIASRTTGPRALWTASRTQGQPPDPNPPTVSLPVWFAALSPFAQYVRLKFKGKEDFREKMKAAYKFAVDRCGYDNASTSLWREYLTFLKSDEGEGSYLQSSKVGEIRDAYRRACLTPRRGIDALFSEHTDYEKSIDTTTTQQLARKSIDGCTRSYQRAKKVSRELEQYTRAINSNLLARPPRGDRVENEQLRAWMRYLEWEQGNPMGYEGAQQDSYIARVRYAPSK